MLPVFLVPAIGLLFLLLSLGKKEQKQTGPINGENAFNAKLPAANIKETGDTKFDVYMKAMQDSAKLKEAQQKDPYEKAGYNPALPPAEQQEQLQRSFFNATHGVDPNEKKVNDRLDRIFKQLNQPENSASQQSQIWPGNVNNNNGDMQRLEKLMTSLQTSADTSSDPEMNRLDKMLDKILAIQNPEQIKKKLPEQEQEKSSPNAIVSTEQNLGNNVENGFFSFQSGISDTAVPKATTIQAVIHADQVIHDDSKVKIRLLQDMYVNNKKLAKGGFLFGQCRIENERVQIEIKSLTIDNTIYPVQLVVYDNDGIVGLFCPGSTSNTSDQKLNQALQTLDLYNTDPSLKSQAAVAGMQTVKSLLTKKTKRAEARLKADYMVLLKNNNLN